MLISKGIYIEMAILDEEKNAIANIKNAIKVKNPKFVFIIQDADGNIPKWAQSWYETPKTAFLAYQEHEMITRQEIINLIKNIKITVGGSANAMALQVIEQTTNRIIQEIKDYPANNTEAYTYFEK